MKKLFILFIAVAGLGVSAYAQNSVTKTATSSATIIGPLTLTKTNDLNFGSIVPGAAASNVVITAAAAPTRTPDGTTTCIGAFTSITFAVGGQAGTTYSIAYPATVTLAGGGPSMICTLSCSTGKTANSIATSAFYIGGSLAVGTAAAQTAGAYISPAFDVTVAYE